MLRNSQLKTAVFILKIRHTGQGWGKYSAEGGEGAGGVRFYVTRPTSLSEDTGSRGKNQRHHGAGLNREGPSISM